MANPLITMTTTMGQMADQLRLYTKLQTYFGIAGVTGEPMSSISNRTMQKLFTRRMPWRFNQEEFAPFPWGKGNFMVSQAGFQQIQFAGASVFVLLPQSNPGTSPYLPAGGVGIDLAATKIGNFTYGAVNGGTNSVTIDPTTGIISVQTLDPHPYQPQNLGQSIAYLTGLTNPAFNAVYTYNSTLSTAAWTEGFLMLGIQGVYNFTVQGTLGQQYGHVNGNTSVTGNTATVTVTNTMSPGDIMTFILGGSTGLNGIPVTLISTTPTTVTFTIPTGVTVNPGTDAGYIYAYPSGAPGIFNCSWLQSADIFDINSNSFPPPLDQVKAVHRKAKEYTVTGDVTEIAILKDANNGVITFRLTEPQSAYPYGFSLTIQKRAPKMSMPGDVFPWPDELSFVIFEMCLAEACRICYGFSGEETQLQQQIAMNSLMAALESQDREDNTQSMTPDWSLMR